MHFLFMLLGTQVGHKIMQWCILCWWTYIIISVLQLQVIQ